MLYYAALMDMDSLDFGLLLGVPRGWMMWMEQEAARRLFLHTRVHSSHVWTPSVRDVPD